MTGALVGPFAGAFVGGLTGVLVGPFVGGLTGTFVGAFVGFLVGGLSGAFVGALVGFLVGGFTGALVGAFVGSLTGFLVGALDGFFVGGLTGALVGFFVGGLTGVLVGAFVGAFVGGLTGTFIGGWTGVSCALTVKSLLLCAPQPQTMNFSPLPGFLLVAMLRSRHFPELTTFNWVLDPLPETVHSIDESVVQVCCTTAAPSDVDLSLTAIHLLECSAIIWYASETGLKVKSWFVALFEQDHC